MTSRTKAALFAAVILTGAFATVASGSGIGNEAASRGSGFAFYVMSLSWSPSYCAAEGLDANNRQCGAKRDYAFIAHGLWPQYRSGYPEYCPSSAPDRVPSSLVSRFLDIMPSAGLIGHQWRKHGTCTGLNQADYLQATREAFERIDIPDDFDDADSAWRVSADRVEAKFIAANPGLTSDAIAVSCKGGRLAEVRICMSTQLEFQACPEVDVRGCHAADLSVPKAP